MTWTSELSSPAELAVGRHFHAGHGTRTTLVFLCADGEASRLVSLLPAGAVHLENTYSCIIKVVGQV